MICSLRCKLCMLGIPLSGPANVFCDNKSVVTNATVPTSTLKKKHLAIYYDLALELCASGTLWIAFEFSKTNLADLLTKLMPGTTKRVLCGKFMHQRQRLDSVSTNWVGPSNNSSSAMEGRAMSWSSMGWELHEASLHVFWVAGWEQQHHPDMFWN